MNVEERLMSEAKQLFSELNSRTEKLIAFKRDTLMEFDELAVSYEKGLYALRDAREANDDKIHQYSEGKIDTFNKLKKVVQNIDVFEKNLNKVNQKINILIDRKKTLSGLMKILMGGGIPQRKELDKPINKGYLRIYDEFFAPSVVEEEDDVSSMLAKKDNYLTGVNQFFSLLEEDVKDIDSELERLRDVAGQIRRNLSTSKEQHEKLQKNYSIYTELIKRGKMEQGVLVREEKTLQHDYEKLLNQLHLCSDISAEERERLENTEKESGERGKKLSSGEAHGVEDVGVVPSESELEHSILHGTGRTVERDKEEKSADELSSDLSPETGGRDDILERMETLLGSGDSETEELKKENTPSDADSGITEEAGQGAVKKNRDAIFAAPQSSLTEEERTRNDDDIEERLDQLFGVPDDDLFDDEALKKSQDVSEDAESTEAVSKTDKTEEGKGETEEREENTAAEPSESPDEEKSDTAVTEEKHSSEEPVSDKKKTETGQRKTETSQSDEEMLLNLSESLQ